MSSVWRKTLVYLGLVEETEDDELPERFPEPRRQEHADDRTFAEPTSREASNVRPLRVTEPGSTHVRAMSRADSGRVEVVQVADFQDAEQIGSRYRNGEAVLFDLSGLDQTEARRILDFVSGVTYALRGRLVKAGRRSFLLLGEEQEVGRDERRRLAELGYELQA